MVGNNKTVSTRDHEEVVATVAHYVNGMREGSAETVARAFHGEAVMYGYAGGQLLGGRIENLFDYVRQFGPAPNIRTRIDVLAITPTTAVVRVDMEQDATGSSYTDFHSLLKQDGAWTVIAKLFHQYES